MDFFAISTFFNHLYALLDVKRGVYANVYKEIEREFKGKSLEALWQNRDMILDNDENRLIKLRLADKGKRLSKADGYRCIYLINRATEKIIFLDIYPKRGPKQKISASESEIAKMLQTYQTESNNNSLKSYTF